jgi:hypothetical protein
MFGDQDVTYPRQRPQLVAAASPTPQGAERRRHPRRPTDARAIVRMGAGVSLFGRVLDVSQGGACIEFPREVRGRVGEWVVLDGDEPFRHGFDASVVAIDGRRWRLAFDPALVLLGIFSPPRGQPRG